MDVVVYPDPVLRRGGKTIESFDTELEQLAAQMFEAMYAEGGVGLAAPQVAIEQKLLVLNPTGSTDDRSGEKVLINPKITRKKGREYGEEGCLSFPGIYAEIERPERCKVKACDVDGQPIELEFDGFVSRIVQHEYDHLEGVLLVDRMSSADKVRHRAALEDLIADYKEQRATAAKGAK